MWSCVHASLIKRRGEERERGEECAALAFFFFATFCGTFAPHSAKHFKLFTHNHKTLPAISIIFLLDFFLFPLYDSTLPLCMLVVAVAVVVIVFA